MPDRYWVGGTASWDGTAGTKWAATSGGAGGASVPTSADDVFFDAASTGTVTIATGNTGAKSINCTGFTGTLTGTAAITVSGNITLVAGQTYTHTGTVTFNATATLITAGKSFSAVTVNGSGITLTLGDALNISTRTITVTQGTFTTANFNVTAGDLLSNNANTRTITLGSSTVTLSAGTPLWGTNPTQTNLTFNANTSQINLTNPLITLQGAFTYHNVTIGDSQNNNHTIVGANTFNNLTFVNRANNGTNRVTFSADQTINGTLTANSGVTVPWRRAWFLSNTPGTNRTLTSAANNLKYVDFRNITGAGAASWSDSSRTNYWGDTGGNSGITFATGRSTYWNLAGTQDWTATAWALTNNGTPNANNYPLVQDTATFTQAGSAGTINLSSQGLMIGNITMADGVSNRTSAITWSFGSFDRDNVFGDVTLFSGLTTTGGSSREFIFSGYNKTQTLTSGGASFSLALTMRTGYLNTLQLGDALTTGGSLIVNSPSATFNANNYSVTAASFNSSTSEVRTITMGSGLWTLTGTGTVWSTAVTTGLTFNKNTADILLSNTTTTARTFDGGGLAYNKLTIGGATGTSVLTVNGANSFTELAATKTVAHTVRFSANQGTIDTWSITGSVGNVVTVDSSVAGTRRTFNLTNVTSGIDYLSVKDVGVNQANRYYVGANSTDGGNNLNVIFTAAPAAGVTINSPAANIDAAPVVPSLASGKLVSVPVADTSIEALLPDVASGKLVSVPVADTSVAAPLPNVASGKFVPVPVVDTSVTSFAPQTLTGKVVNVPNKEITLQAEQPSIASGKRLDIESLQISVTPLAPQLASSVIISAPSGTLSVGTNAPIVFTNPFVQVPAANLGISPLAPVTLTGFRADVPNNVISIAGQNPRGVGVVGVGRVVSISEDTSANVVIIDTENSITTNNSQNGVSIDDLYNQAV